MTVDMDDSQITTLEQVAEVLGSSKGLTFKGAKRDERYAWMEAVLERFDYFELSKKAKGLVKAYLRRMTGFSRPQVTRLVTKKLRSGTIKASYAGCHRMAVKYTRVDHELLAETDNAHERLSGPATRKLLMRAYEDYKDKRFARLKDISSAHIYNLRQSRTYRLRAQTVAKTKSVAIAIGARRRPETKGRPGFIRVDTVHQGDLGGKKGVYHVNMVDAETQWEVVACVENISENYLLPVLEKALGSFPFMVLGFHSDNGSEYINEVTAGLLNKLLIEQTKSRSGRTNDNALVEGKNGNVIRKHMGHWYIEQRHAPTINWFYEEHFNDYLNFHRPCGFATVTVDAKGKRSRKYKTYQTPYERLKGLVEAAREEPTEPEKYLRPGVTLASLDAVAAKQSDTAAAQAMQEAKGRLFKRLGAAGALPVRPRAVAVPARSRKASSPSGPPRGSLDSSGA